MTFQHTVKLYPSILSCDYAKLGDTIQQLDSTPIDGFHLDVMDGHFVENISFGPALIQSIRPYTSKPFDVHLMISPVTRYLNEYARAGADRIIVHYEAEDDLLHCLERAHDTQKKVGIALNPDTPIQVLEPYLKRIDMVLCMTVYPGQGGQALLPASYQRLSALKSLIEPYPIDLGVDGGINPETIREACTNGASVCVVGSYLFNNKHSLEHNIDTLRQLTQRHCPESR